MTLAQRTTDGVTWLTFDRPDKLNAFTVEAYQQLRIALERYGADDDTRVIVLTGNGRAFSAGADRSLLDGTSTTQLDAGAEFDILLGVLLRLEKPLLAAVNGLAIGFGATVLLHCDLVVMADSARVRFPFTALGLAAEAGSSVLLPANARFPDVMWSMLSSEWIDAAAAERMGLAWRVVPDDALAEETTQAAAAIAAHDPAAVAAVKRLLLDGRATAVEAAIARENAAMGVLMAGRG